ncbi:MAG: hypothetical protein ACRD2P_11715 [Terriglobia bacterium]
MAEHSTSARYFVSALVALAIVVSIYVVVQHRRAQPPVTAQRPMTPVEKGYLSEIQVKDPAVSAASNFLGDTVYYLDGEIINQGSQTAREVDLALSFMDPFGEVVSRRVEHVITRAGAPLKPAASLHLHLIFEHVPDAWNQGPPVITPTYVSLH